MVLAALAGLSWRSRPAELAPPPPLEQRLASLDVPVAAAAVEQAIASARTPTAMGEADTRMLPSFLALAASAARLQVATIEVVEAGPVDGLAAVDALVAVRGDIYDLPVFLDAIYHQRALVQVEEVVVRASPGGQAEMDLRTRSFRPPSTDTRWIAPRLAVAAPGCDRATPVLERAAVLAAWRRYRAEEPGIAARSVERRQQIAADLPTYLVALRRTGGQVSWAPDDGIRVRRRRG